MSTSSIVSSNRFISRPIITHKKTRAWRVFLRTYFSVSIRQGNKKERYGQVVQNVSFLSHDTILCMKVYLATDHGGYELKEILKKWLKEEDFEVEDIGAHSFDPNDDYPDFIIPLARKVAQEPDSLGIISGRSGNGEAIAANKIKGIRAAVCINEEMARKAKEHNNANILSLGADYMSVDEAKNVVKAFLETPFSNDVRHVRRIEKIKKIEENP